MKRKNIKKVIKDIWGDKKINKMQIEDSIYFHNMTREETEILGYFCDFTGIHGEQLKGVLVRGYLIGGGRQMRGTYCNRDTFRVTGYHKPTKRRMFLMFLKKLMKINSPSMGPLGYTYEYDYLKAKYFGGK